MAAWTMTGLCGSSAAWRPGELRAGSHIGPFIFAARTHVARDYGALGLALDALEGLSVGDALGEQFFLAPDRVRVAIAQRWHPAPPWHWTDDTNMALSIVEVLLEHGSIEADQLAGASPAVTTPPGATAHRCTPSWGASATASRGRR